MRNFAIWWSYFLIAIAGFNLRGALEGHSSEWWGFVGMLLCLGAMLNVAYSPEWTKLKYWFPGHEVRK